MTEPLGPPCKHPVDKPKPGCPGCIRWHDPIRGEDYRAVCAIRVGKPDPRPKRELVVSPGGKCSGAGPGYGPGTEIKTMTSQMGVPACMRCAAYAAKMDLWGVEGCKEHFEEIVAHLEEEAKRLGWFKWVQAGAKAVLNGLPKTPRGLVEEAIRRAEEDTHAETKTATP